MTKMTSNRPYLVRAIYDWIVDNHCTPHLVVDANYRGVSVPQQYVNDGQIILNVAPRAVGNFSIDLKSIGFSTRFGGVPTEIYIPILAVLGVYARENGQGLMFSPEEMADVEHPEGDEPPPPPKPKGGKKPSLKVIK